MNGSLFSAWWAVSLSRKHASDEKASVGILAFEVCSLMLKVAYLWQTLTDDGIMSLRDDIVNSLGVKILVSDDDAYLMELALKEILCNFKFLAMSVARLSKKCEDPIYHRYEQFVNNPVQNRLQWSGWEYRLKKMERKVKKMERFGNAMMQLSQELDKLEEREQTLRRMQANPGLSRIKLLEFQHKVKLQRQEVQTLRDMSPWNRTYDYVVRLLARSLFTILERIVHVFGNYHQLPIEQHQNDYERVKKTSTSASTTTTHHQTEHVGSFVGCMSVGTDSPVLQRQGSSRRLNNTTTGHMRMVNNNKVKRGDKSCMFNRMRIYYELSIHGKVIRPVPFTLGDAALALHYANVIILIEKIASSPHMLDHETRDYLYNMLPTTIRSALRTKLKRRRSAKSKASSSSGYDANINNVAAKWGMVVRQILEWLAPLAHNMIKFHSERNFERERTTPNANVLLVQTLYFANQAKAEAAIVELLVGLNYICRINIEAGVRSYYSSDSAGVRLRTRNIVYDEFL